MAGTIRQALPALAPGGTLVLVGLATPAIDVGLYDLVPQERVIKRPMPTAPRSIARRSSG